MEALTVDPESSGSESITGVVGRLLQNIVALLEARVDLTRQEVRAALRDVAIALFLLVAALALILLIIPVAVAVLVLVLVQAQVPAWLATAIVLAMMLAVVAVLLVVARLRLRKRRLAFLAGLREDWRGIRQALERQR